MKTTLADLAIFGGRPAFPEPLHVGSPHLGDRRQFLERVECVLERRWLTNGGPFVEQLEQRLAALLGVRHVIAVSNATAGLEIVLRALDLHGEVILPAMTFVATAHAVRWLGLTPVFADIDPATHNLDPASVAANITPRTSAILGVHLWGRPCAPAALADLAAAHGLALLFDAAHAFACSHAGRMLGGFGQAEVFSFHATKVFNTFEGGAVTTNDDALAARLRLMRNFGFSGYDQVDELGINAKLNEVSAAMGLSQLDGLPQVIESNRANYAHYRGALDGLPGIQPVVYNPSEAHNYHYVVFEIAPAAGLSRDELVRLLWSEGVLARRYFYPGVHRMQPYCADPFYAGLALPHTERLVERTLLLPNGPLVTPAEIDAIAAIIRLALSQPRRVRDALHQPPNPPRVVL